MIFKIRPSTRPLGTEGGPGLSTRGTLSCGLPFRVTVLLGSGLDVSGGAGGLWPLSPTQCRSFSISVTGLDALGHHWPNAGSSQPVTGSLVSLRFSGKSWALSFPCECFISESLSSRGSALLLVLGCYRWVSASIWAAAALTLPSDNPQRPGLEENQMQTTQRVKIPDTGRRRRFSGKCVSCGPHFPPPPSPPPSVPPTITSSRRSAVDKSFPASSFPPPVKGDGF